MKYQVFKRYEDIVVYNEEQVRELIGDSVYYSCETYEEVKEKLANVIYNKDVYETNYEHIQTGDEQELAILNNDLTEYISK